MRYYKDFEGDIWEWNDSLTDVRNVYYIDDNSWDEWHLEQGDTFEAVNERWELKEITDEELFTEMI